MVQKYKVRSFLCVGCGKKCEFRSQQGRRYCSLDCYRSGPRPARRTTVKSECSTCGKETFKKPASPRSFCSRECHNIYQGRNKVAYQCIICGIEFKISPSTAKSRGAKYCSIQCRNKCPDWKQKSVIAGNVAQTLKKGPNRLEIAGISILQDIKVDFIEQHTIDGKFTVDAFLNKYNIAIQWDGEYWHGYPNRINQEGIDERQRKRVILDNSQDKYMRSRGIKVLRFWQREVDNEKEKVCEIILSAIHEAAR